LQRKEGNGYMQQIIKLNFGFDYINQNAHPLQTIQHKKQTLQQNHRNTVNNLKTFKLLSHLTINNNTNDSKHANTFKQKKVATHHKFKNRKKQTAKRGNNIAIIKQQPLHMKAFARKASQY
jgi:hypothetical protein